MPVGINDVRPKGAGAPAAVLPWGVPDNLPPPKLARRSEGWRAGLGKPRRNALYLSFSFQDSTVGPVKRLLNPLLSALSTDISDISYLLEDWLSPGFPPPGNPATI